MWQDADIVLALKRFVLGELDIDGLKAQIPAGQSSDDPYIRSLLEMLPSVERASHEDPEADAYLPQLYAADYRHRIEKHFKFIVSQFPDILDPAFVKRYLC